MSLDLRVWHAVNGRESVSTFEISEAGRALAEQKDRDSRG